MKVINFLLMCLLVSFVYSTRLSTVSDENDDVDWAVEDETDESLKTVDDFSTPMECLRPCKIGRPKKCYYKFHLEQYTVLGKACEICTPNKTNGCQCILADGVERMAFTANRMIPGPAIEVCEKDTVIIDIINQIQGSAVTIHWHGVLQHDSQFYDGVPYVTQCPILPGNTFRYIWKANEPGTHFWHSHIGLQKIDGLSGPIIIREKKSKDLHSHLYDHDLSDHVIFLQDWTHEYMDEKFPGRIHSSVSQRPASILINGKGSFQDPITEKYTNISPEVFVVSYGDSYRFRMINAMATVCPVQITIEDHTMSVITTDGHPIEPVNVNTIISASAERYDFIINADKAPGYYWIHVKGLEECKSLKIDQVAILKYEGSSKNTQTPRPTYDDSYPVGKVLNPLDADCAKPRSNAICISQLKFKGQLDKEILSNEVEKIYLPFKFAFPSPADFYKPNTYDKHFIAAGVVIATGMIDNITNELPPSPLLSQYYDIDRRTICNAERPIKKCGLTCKCTHVIKIPYGSIVELVLIDSVLANGIHHPFHLHGFAFHVMGVGKMPEPIKGNLEEAIRLDQEDRLHRRKDKPPLKDTIMIPSNGYVVLRFIAKNQGFWLLHCHFLLHLVTGMSAIFQVGDINDMPDAPHTFPICGNHLPRVY